MEKFIVFREEYGISFGYVRLKDKYTIVSDMDLSKAKVFESSVNAKSMAYELNKFGYSPDSTWQIKQID